MEEIRIEYIKSEVNRLDISKWEDFKTYHKLRDLLLDNGFINNDNTTLKEAYFDIFPTNEPLEKELKTSLKDILSKDEDVRIKASKYLEKAPRKIGNMVDTLWLKEPRTISILCKALDNETNDKIIENLVLCLGNIAQRHNYNNLEIFDKIVSKFKDAKDRLKIRIAQSCGHFPAIKKWEYIYEALNCKSKKDAIIRLTRHLRNQHEEIPKELKLKFKEKLRAEFYNEKNKNEEVKDTALETAIILMQKEDLEELKNIRDNYTVWKSTEGIIKRRIEELENE